MAGRKPLPTHLKLVKGTARPHRLNKAEPKPVVATPEPPGHLDEAARDKFTEMAELLARHGVMTELDTGALARYVIIWRRWLEAEAEVKRRGPVVKTSNDNIIQNPFLAVANKCLAQMAQIERPAQFRWPDPHVGLVATVGRCRISGDEAFRAHARVCVEKCLNTGD